MYQGYMSGCSSVSHLDILVLLYVSALYSQLAGLGVKVDRLHTQSKSCANSGAANASSGGLCLYLPVGTNRKGL